MMNYDFDDRYEHEENFDEDNDFPFIGQVKRFLMQRENGEFYMKKYEYTQEGVWVASE
jgi:hypothetical protein